MNHNPYKVGGIRKYDPRTFGLTEEEKNNEALAREYASNYNRRTMEIGDNMPPHLSYDYEMMIKLRYQMLRDLITVCKIQVKNSGIEWQEKPIFIEQCENKIIECETEMCMLQFGFEFLDGNSDVVGARTRPPGPPPCCPCSTI